MIYWLQIITTVCSCATDCTFQCSADNIGPPVQSARLSSIDGFAFRYGRVEIRAKLPTGDWLWPALWMMPKLSVYGGWPRSGEIDIMESRGNRNYVANGRQIGVKQTASTLHFGTESYNSAWQTAHFERNADGLNGNFHVYELEWTPSKFVLLCFAWCLFGIFAILAILPCRLYSLQLGQTIDWHRWHRKGILWARTF